MIYDGGPGLCETELPFRDSCITVHHECALGSSHGQWCSWWFKSDVRGYVAIYDERKPTLIDKLLRFLRIIT